MVTAAALAGAGSSALLASQHEVATSLGAQSGAAVSAGVFGIGTLLNGINLLSEVRGGSTVTSKAFFAASAAGLAVAAAALITSD